MLKLAVIDKLSPDLHGTNNLFPITYFVLKPTFKALWSCWAFDSLCAHFTNFASMVGAPGKLPRSLSGEHLTYRAAPFKLTSNPFILDAVWRPVDVPQLLVVNSDGAKRSLPECRPLSICTYIYIKHIRHMSRYIITIVIIRVIVIVISNNKIYDLYMYI